MIDYYIKIIYNINNYTNSEGIFMKRIIPLIFCVLFLFAGCSGEADNSTTVQQQNSPPAEDYVGEGTMTVLRYLISSNANCVENIFIENNLPVESGKDIKEGKTVYSPVKSANYNTYEDFENTLNATYTQDAVKSILAEFNMYKNIDGKLYLNTGYKKAEHTNYDWSNPQINVTAVAENSYELEITVLNENGDEHILKATAVNTDGDLKLKNIIY